MSATVDLDIFTGPYPTISNNIEVRVYLQSAPLAIIDYRNLPQPHGLHIWSFPGMPRTNLLFRIFEMSGSTIVRQLGLDMNVSPGTANGVTFKATEQIEADVTTGFVSGVDSVTFDGTAGAEDWRTWEISTLDRIGYGPMKKGVDYTWDKTLGKLQLLTPGDIFAPIEWFNVEFDAQTSAVTSSTPVILPAFSTPKIITANYSVTAGGDMGGLLIVDPAGAYPANVYLELSLPDLQTVVPGRLLTIEMRRATVNKCSKIITFGTDYIDWLQGNRSSLFICPQESLSLYRFIDPAGTTTGMWRVYNPFGNWMRVGEQITDDNLAANVFNKVLINGGRLDVFAFARVYNDYVTQLGAQVVNYDDWAVGNSKYKFSLANSANPANASKFFVPDRSNQFERITDGARTPGDWADMQMLDHRHEETVGSLTPTLFGKSTITRSHGTYNSQANGVDDFTGPMIDSGGNLITKAGSEVRPVNIAVRKYLLV